MQSMNGTASPFPRTWRPVTLALLVILLTAALVGITSALKGPDWASLWRSLLLGLFLGWILAILHQSPLRTFLIVAAMGSIYVLLFPGGLVWRLSAIQSEWLRWLLSVLHVHEGQTVSPDTLFQYLQEFRVSTGILLRRVQTWLVSLSTGQAEFDPVAAGVVWNMLVWLAAAWTGWAIEARRNALLAVFPVIFLSLGTLAYGLRMSFVLYVMLISTLLLLAIVQQQRRQQDWNETGVAYPMEKGRQIIQTAFLVSLVLVFLSYLLPSLSIQRIRDWLDEHRQTAQSGGLAKSLGILPGGTAIPDAFEAARSPGLPRDHLIDSGPELSTRVVMTISVDNLSSIVQAGQPLPLYWRGFTYDVYTGHGWSSSPSREDAFQVNQVLPTEAGIGHVGILQDVRPVEDLGGVIYAAGEPIAINLQGEAAWRRPGDLFGLQTARTMPYMVRSLLPVAEEKVLQTAGQRYPDWIREDYLTLPPEVPQRVKDLALELTASAATPYDRARAIESYLRTFPYTLDVPRPPANRDVVDYFLFDLKKGYCDYYASAMVVLARAAGVPARLAIGYAPGTYNLNSRRFVVTEADAHSWVEVYFPGVGWVPFEPTAARPSLERTEAIPSQPSQTPQPAGESAHPIPSWNGWWLSLPGILAFALLLGVARTAWDEFRLSRLPERESAAEILRRLRQAALRLAVASESGDTPYELSAAFCQWLQTQSSKKAGARGEDRTIQEIQAITGEVVRICYHHHPPTAEAMLHIWRRLRWRLALIWILKVWRSNAAHFHTWPDKIPLGSSLED